MSFLRILPVIYNVLYNNTTVNSLVGKKIFPNVIPDKMPDGTQVKYPAIAMWRASIDINYAKGCVVEGDSIGANDRGSSVIIEAKANSYSEAIDLIEAVRGALEFLKGEDGDVKINKCTIADVAEGFDESCYWQRMVFDIR